MVLSFSRTYGFYDYLFINDSVIEKVESFKYLGTFFSNNLKWHANSDYVYGKLKQRFFAFSKFKHFRPSLAQRELFIKTIIFPVLSYNIELWYGSATKKEREKLTGLFYRQSFDLDIEFFISDSIQKLATDFITDVNHILHCCYVKGRSKFIMPKTRTNRFLKSFVPRSVQILNSMKCDRAL